MPKLRYSEFKDRLDVDQFESAIGFHPLSQQGGNDIGYCVFPENHSHGDTTGKFAIHREKMVYNCFVCGGGSLLSLVMELHEFDVDQATKWIYQFATGTDNRSDTEFRDYLLELLEDTEYRHDTMPYFNERVLERFSKDTWYFEDRGIDSAVAKAYNLRYSDFVMKSAPIKGGEKIDVDYCGPAAVFPHYWRGKLIGWQHRWLDWDEENTKVPRWLAKYTNTTDFPKDCTLFNYDKALHTTQPVVVVESVPTALFVISAGRPAVAYFGGGIKPAQLRLLRRFSQGVILAPDNDKTGDNFVSTATQYLERYIEVYVTDKVDLGPKADLGDYAKSDRPYHWLEDHLQWRTHRTGVLI